MTGRILRSAVGALAALIIGAGVASAQAPVLSTAVSGNNVTLNWTATAGAAGYRVDAGTASGTPTTSAACPWRWSRRCRWESCPTASYFLRIVALPGNEASAEVVLQLPLAPAAPTNLQVARNGTALVATWSPGAGGGTVTGYQLRAGLAPGSHRLPCAARERHVVLRRPGAARHLLPATRGGERRGRQCPVERSGGHHGGWRRV